MNQNSVNDRNVTMQEQDFQKHLLRFERTLSTRGLDDRHNYTSSGLAAQTGGE